MLTSTATEARSIGISVLISLASEATGTRRPPPCQNFTSLIQTEQKRDPLVPPCIVYNSLGMLVLDYRRSD